MPHPETTPKRTGGICSTLRNIFSPGGTKPKNSSPSESSASYVDPDVAEKIEEEGPSQTTTPGINSLEDLTTSLSDTIEESGPNETESGTVIESNAGSGGETPQDETLTEAVTSDPPEDLTTGGGNEEEDGDTSGPLPSEILTNDPLLQEYLSGNSNGDSPPTLIKKMSGMFFVVAMTEKTSLWGRIPVFVFFSGSVHPGQNFSS
jgi:hypothetical protein